MEPLQGSIVFALIIFWFVFWLLLLRCIPVKLTAPVAPAAAAACPESAEDAAVQLGKRQAVEFYQRKLRRMQVFAISSSVSGFALLLSCFAMEDPVVELLVAFGPFHQVFFTMSISHWFLNLLEDWKTRAFLGQGLSGEAGGGLALFPLNLCCGPKDIMLVMYQLHHIVTIIAYCYSLATFRLGGVMVQGLIFEFPVVFMLRRELAVAMDPVPQWLRGQGSVDAHWLATYVAWTLGRGPSLALWIFSVLSVYGADRLSANLRLADIVMYHVMAVFFTCINIRMVGLLLCWHGQDRARAQRLQEASQHAVSRAQNELELGERTGEPKMEPE